MALVLGGTGFAQYQEVVNYTWDNTANYFFTFGNSDLDLIAGFSIQDEQTNTVFAEGNTFADDRLVTLDNAAEITDGGGFRTQYRIASYLLRAQYSLNNQLFINGSLRYDGSSRFGTNNLYGLFPAVSAAYDFSELFQQSPFQQLKLRASYGQTGNAGSWQLCQ